MIKQLLKIHCIVNIANSTDPNAPASQLPKLILDSPIWTNLIIPFGSALFGVLLGGLITWLVARQYYRKASEDLRWEARAGAIPQNVLELLVAYCEWAQDLQPMQKINLSNGRLYSNEELRRLLEHYGLGGGACKVVGSPGFPVGTNKEVMQKALNEHKKKQKRYSTVYLEDDAKGLVSYLKKRRKFTTRVVRLWKTSADGRDLVERLWSIIPGEKQGPVKSLSPPQQRS